jgi:preprotein translocase subunit SecD
MNRYPLWKYVIVLVALAIGLIYTLPNLFGESPAVQVSSAKSTVRLETSLISHVEELLKQNNIPTTGSYFEQNGPNATARFRFESTDVQLKAKDLIERELNKDSTATAPDYTVALNLVSASPAWLTALGAHPMHLGLDLRGGVHFLLQVDMQGALQARYDSMVADARSVLREAKVPVGTIERDGQSLRMDFASAEDRDRAQSRNAPRHA